MSILLADDDAQLATFLSKSLESEGYAVHTALDESSVLAELKRQNYQLIILDLNFGGTDGLNLLERLRRQGLETPVMVLSARDRVADRVASLNLGADDYVTKPFSFQELAARANALLRRKTDSSLNLLRVEDLELDPATRKIHRAKREIKLSPREFDLLHLLMRRSGETINRQELLRECWGQESDTDSNLVDVYVNYLRRKIDSAEDKKLIHTVRGAGYRLGKPAPAGVASFPPDEDTEPMPSMVSHTYPSSAIPEAGPAVQPGPLRALIHAMAHDLAQPLTSVRCFLEVLAMRGNEPPPENSDLKTIGQQADRAVALAKGISSLVRETPLPAEPWISLDGLLNEIFIDFVVLLHSGLLTLERQWDPSLQVTSSPVLRQLLVLLLCKLVGRNTRPLALAISAKATDGGCRLDMRWRPNDASPTPAPDARNVFNRELGLLQEMAHSIGAELTLPEGQPEFVLLIPAAPQESSKADFVH